MMRVRIEIQLVDDGGDRLDDVAADTRRERVLDFGRLRPGRLEPVLLQDRREPMLLDLTATPVPEQRKRWWRR